MAPAPPPRRLLSKTALPAALSTAKTQAYSDVSAPQGRSTRTGSLLSGPGGGGPISSSNIRTLAWSPLGTLIATADAKVLRVWNPEKPGVKYSTELKGPPTSAAQAPVQPNGAAGRPPPTAAASPHLAGTERVAWNPVKEAELASVGTDGVVRFWDVRNRGACVGEVKCGGEGFSLAWRPNGEEVIVGRKDDYLVPISRQTLTAIAHHQQSVQTNQIAFTNSGDELLLTTGDSQVKILDYPSMTVLHTLNAHTSSCYTVVPCPRGRYIAVGGSDALITLWDTTDFACRHSLADMTGPVRSLSFSFDGSFITGGSDEGTGIMIAHVETGEYVHTIPTTHPTPCVAWHPSRYWLAYSGEPAGLKIVGAAGGIP